MALRSTLLVILFGILALGVASGAIAPRVSTTASTANTSLTINKPVGVVPGDVMIVNISQLGNNTTDPTNSGWTLIDGAVLRTGGTLNYGAVLYRIADASDGPSYAFTLGTGVSSAVGSIVAFSGVDTSGATPFDVTPQNIFSNTAGSTAVIATNITTVTTNAAVIMFGMAGGNPTWTNWATTLPGALTELYDNQATSASVGAAWAIKPTPGTTGNGTATLSVSQRNGGILIALKPAVATTTSVATSGSPSTYGDPVTFTATVTPSSGTAVGTVNFYDGVTLLGSGTLDGNNPPQAVYTTTATQLVAGAHTNITAVYQGSTTHAASTSAAITQTVNALTVQLAGTRVYDGTATAAAADLTVTNNLDGANLTLSGSAVLSGKDVGLQTITNLGIVPVRVNSATGNSGANAVTTFNVNMPAPADGNTLIAVISTRGTSAGRVTNIVQTGAIWTRATQAANAGGTTTEIWYAPNVSGAATSLVVTQASLRSAVVVMEYSGILAASPLDQTNSATGNSTAAVTGTTPATTQANELWIGGIGLTNSGYTLGLPLNQFVSVASAQSTNGTAGNNAKVYALERTVTTTGAAGSGGTVSTSSQWSGAIATFRAVQSAPPMALAGSAATNYTLTGSSGSMTITPKPLTVAGLTALNKYYDGDTNATLSGTSALQPPEAAGSGTTADGRPYNGDVISVTGTPVGGFADPAIGNGKPVSVTGLSLVGDQVGNYTLTPLTLSANIVPGPATQLVFGVQPTDTTATAAIAPAVTVRILDQFGNLTTNTTSVILTIGVNPGGGTLSGTRTNAAVNGTATFTNLAIDKAGIGYTLVATAVGLAGADSTPFTIFPGNPFKLVITTLPQTLMAGVTSSPITLQMQDVAGNLATSTTNRTVTLTTSSGGGAFRDAANFGNITTIVLPAGTSTTNYLYLDTVAGTPTLTNAAAGLIAATQTETVLPAAATQIRVETLATGAGTVVPAQNITSGNSLTVYAIARDAFGNFVANIAADAWSLSTKTGGVVDGDLVPAGDGKSAVFTGHLVGTATVSASAGVLTSVDSGTLTVVASAVTKLVFITAPQILTAGSNSAVITVQLQDALGNPANTTSNRVITLTSSSAGAVFLSMALAPITTITISTGFNSTNYFYRATLAGSATITNATPGLATITQTETVIAAAATMVRVETLANGLGVIVPAQNIIAGNSLTVYAITRDAFSNFVANVSADAWSLTNITGGVNATNLAPAGDSKSATFNAFLTGSARVRAVSGTLTNVDSGTLTVLPAAATQLAFGIQPTNTAAAISIAPAVTVRILDPFGNVTTNTTPVVLNIGNNPSGGTLSGTRTNAAVAGTATFNNLSIDKVGTGYTLVATAVGLTQATSAPFNIFAGNPTKLVITSAPQTNTAGVISSPILVQMQDQVGNLATSTTNRTINLTTTSGGGTFRDASNTVNITSLVLLAGTSATNYLYVDTVAGTPTLTNATIGLTSATQTETILPAGASQVRVESLASGAGVVVPTQNLTAGVPTNLFAIFRDPFGNFVTNDAASWVLINPTGGVVSNDLVTAVGGKSATFTGHLIGTAVVQATAPGLSNTVSGTLTVVAGFANKLVIITPSQILTAGSNSAVITVQIQDAFGNPANTTSNRVITLTSSSAGAIFRNAANATIAALTIPTGLNSTNYFFNATLAGLATITNSTLGLTFATQTEIVLAAAASRLIISTQPSATATAGIAFAIQPRITVLDTYSNTVTSFGSAITAAQTTGGNLNGSLTAPTALPLSGIATFSGLFITNAGTTTLTFTAPGLPATNSIAITVSAGAATRIRVETLANGTGTVVPAQDLISGFSLTNYAIARDFYGNFVTNAAVTWSLVNVDGGVLNVDLAPAADGKSAVFTGRLLGSANIHITSGALPTTDSGTITVIQGTKDPDLPDPSAHYKLIPAGSWVIAMDTNNQRLVPPFNLKAYGLVNRLLQNYVPVSWAIRAGKLKDEADFSAPAFRVFPPTNVISILNFAGGPFIIHRDFTNLAGTNITAFGNNVAVYQLTADTVMDIRHELQFQPNISVNVTNSLLHTALLDFAGIPNYTVTNDFSLASNTCFTLFLEPHNANNAGVASAKAFIQSGGNFLAQCASITNYENNSFGHFQSTSNIVTDNLTATPLDFSNPDLPFSQFVGGVSPNPGTSSVQDWTLGGGAFINNGHSHLDDVGTTTNHYAATSSKHSSGPGGLLFYLGGHDYFLSGSGTNDITMINGARMLLNTVFVPANRATCGLEFSAALSITKSDSVTTVTNGQAVTYTIVVQNQGFNTVSNATVRDIMPPALTNVTWTSTGTGGATNLNPSGTGDLNATVILPVYGEVTFTVHATIGNSSACLVTNIATVTAPFGLNEINTNNNVAIDVDHVIPSFSAPQDLSLDCANQVSAAATNVAQFIAIGGSIGASAVVTTLTHVGDNSNGGAGCPASPLIILRSYRLTTACGDYSERTQTITVIDHTPPVIQCAGDKTVVAGSVWSFDTPTAIDGCSTNTISVVGTVTNGLCGDGFVATRTWSATDACGNSSTCNQTVTVQDTSAPTIICATNKTVECGSAWTFDAPNAGIHQVSILNTVTNSLCGNTFTATRTWQAVNDCGTFSQCSQTVTVQDSTPPTINCATNKAVTLGTVWAFDEPTAEDTCGTNAITVVGTVTNTAGYCGNGFAVTRTWRATDTCGNHAECSQLVSVLDGASSTVVCATNKTVEFGSAWTFDPPDAGSDVLSVLSTTTNLTCGLTFVATRTWQATNSCGASSQCSQTVTVQDTTPPTITCATNKSVDAGSTWSFDAPIASDSADGTNVTISVVSSTTNSICGDIFTATWTWRATDACGNSNECSQTVTVLDKTPPVITCPSNLLFTADAGQCSRSNVTFTLEATDNCLVTNKVSTPPSGSTFPVGVTTVTNTATDASGNTSSCTFTVTVADVAAPAVTIAQGADATIECPSVPNFSAPIFVDACAGAITPSVATVTNLAGCTNVITRTWAADDGRGNVTNRSQVIMMVDTTPPAVTTAQGSDATIECPAPPNFTAPVFTDACVGVITPSVQTTTNTVGCTNIITRTWTANDGCGNNTNRSQVITVVDTTPPAVTTAQGENATIECPAVPSFAAPVFTDACAGVITPSVQTTTNTVGCTNIITRTWTANDGCGNSTNRSQVITMVDTTPPAVTTAQGGDAAIECPATPNFTAPVFTDACAGVITPSVQTTTNTVGCTNIITRTWTADDGCANSTNRSQVITVVDTTPPAVATAQGANATIECPAVPNFSAPVFTDACAGAITPSVQTTTNTVGCTNILTRTWTADDGCGNSTNRSQVITVVDTTPPAVTTAQGENATIECPATPSFIAPVFTDACAGVVTPSVQTTTNVVGCTNIITRTWTANDGCGNSTNRSQVITVVDTTPPAVTTAQGANATIECPATPNFTAPVFTDACAGVITPSVQTTTNAVGCTNIVTRTWTANDGCGNSTNRSQVITVIDTTPPAVTTAQGANATIECPATPSFTAPVFTDACAGVITPSVQTTTNTVGCTNIITRTWTANDGCGNSTNRSQVITVIDTTPASVTTAQGANATIECPATPNFTAPVFTDACAGVITPSVQTTTNTVGCTNLITRTWTANDGCGNSTNRSQVITVVDTTSPAVTTAQGANATIECPATPNFSVPVFTDACAGVITPSVQTTTNTVGCTNIITRIWTANDGCGNSTNRTQVITVVDTTPPAVTTAQGADATIECPATPSFTAPVFTDACAGVITPTIVTVTNVVGATNIIRRTWTANDGCGNSTNRSQVITVIDTTPPTISCPADAVVSANAGCTATNVSLGNPVTADSCGLAAVTNNAPAVYSLGTNVVIWTVTDTAGNTQSCTQRVIVRDTTAPAITCPPDVIVSANFGCNATNVNLGTPVTSDNCAVASVTSNSPAFGSPVVVGTSYSIISVRQSAGVATVTWASQAGLTYRLLYKDSLTAATWDVVPGDVTAVGATTSQTNLVGAVAKRFYRVQTLAGGGAGSFAVGTNLVTWTVTDTSGNTNSCVQQVIVRDTSPPIIICPTNLVWLADAGRCSRSNGTFIVTATDNCSVTNLVSTPPSGSTFAVGTTTVTNLATDASGNISVCTFTVTVRDAEPPTITCPTNLVVSTDAGQCFATGVNLGVPLAMNDNCGILTVTNNAPTQYPKGVTTVTWTAEDTSGNLRTCAQTVTVNDTELPTLTCPTNRVVSTAAAQCFATGVNLGVPLATNDNCGILTVTNNAPTQYPKGVTTVTWTAVDTSGNLRTCAQTVTVNDTELPTLTCPTNRVVSTDVGQCFATGVNLGLPPATNDNCGILTVTNNAPVQYPKGVTTVTWTAVDTSGNVRTCAQSVTVNDTELPTLTCPTNRVVSTDVGQCFATGVNLGVPSATNDNCGILTVTNNAPTQYPKGLTTVTWTVVDTSGNFQTCAQVVSVTDNQFPAITCPAAITTNIPSGWSGITNLALGTPVTSDNCGGASVSNNAPVVLPVGTNVIRWTVTDAGGNASSCQQTLVVSGCSRVLSATPLTSQSICQGQTVVFQTTASSPEAITYTWKFNNQTIAGQTTNSLVLPNVGLAASGTYAVEVRTACAAVTNSATLTVLPAPGASPVSYTNTTLISIPESGAASPYGSVITPQCVPGTVKNLTVSLFGFFHFSPLDVTMMLISPDDRRVMLIAVAGGFDAVPAPGVNLTFSDAASTIVPQIDALVPGVYLPTDYLTGGNLMPFPANGTYSTNLSVFNGVDPNGAWKLYVYDDSPYAAGGILGWSLNLDWQVKTLSLQKPAKLANGGFQIEVVGQTNVSIILQRSSNLTTWLPVATNVFPTNPGVFVDPAPLGPYRFYRAVQP